MGQEQITQSSFDAIRIGGQDKNGRTIEDVYACETDRYAVYQTSDRVIVLYGEDPLVQRAQRNRLVKLAQIRSRIDGDLADWRGKSASWSLWKTARQFDMRVASALVDALEGDVGTAVGILTQIATEVEEEKASRARLSYLLWAYAAAALLIALCVTVYGALGGFATLDKPSIQSVALAVFAGLLSSLYSISLTISNRVLRNDQRRLDHVTDAMVRISIGALAAFVLQTFLLSGTIRIGFGDAGDLLVGGGNTSGVHPTSWPVSVIAGFLAGFAERLVPDLLNSYKIKARDPDPVPAPATGEPFSGAGAASGGAAAFGGTPGPTGPNGSVAGPIDVEALEDASDDDDVDACVEGHADDDIVTDDENLPAASGGVARD